MYNIYYVYIIYIYIYYIYIYDYIYIYIYTVDACNAVLNCLNCLCIYKNIIEVNYTSDFFQYYDI